MSDIQIFFRNVIVVLFANYFIFFVTELFVKIPENSIMVFLILLVVDFGILFQISKNNN